MEITYTKQGDYLLPDLTLKETKKGIKGIKGYGTFSKINPLTKTSTKIYYEILLFSQNGDLQQIIILHEEGDKYANEITDRVLNSVELKTINQ